MDETIDEMYVTKYNTLTLIVEPSGANFLGVNVRSTHPGTVRVNQIDQRHYDLVYGADGKATIEVWNGDGSNKTAFEVTAKEIIYIEKVIWEIDGKEQPLKYIFKSQQEQVAMEQKLIHPEENGLTVEDYDWDYLKKEGMFQAVYDSDLAIRGTIHQMSFLRIEPENTSYRILEFEAVRFYSDFWVQRAREWYQLSWNWANYKGPVSGWKANVFFAADYEGWFKERTPVGGDVHVNYYFKMKYRLGDGPSVYSNFYSYAFGEWH